MQKTNKKLIAGTVWGILAVAVLATVALATEINRNKQQAAVMLVSTQGVSAAKLANQAAREQIQKDNAARRAAGIRTFSAPTLPAPVAATPNLPKPSKKPVVTAGVTTPDDVATQQALAKARAAAQAAADAANQGASTAVQAAAAAAAVANEVVQAGQQAVGGAGATANQVGQAGQQAVGAVVQLSGVGAGYAVQANANALNTAVNTVETPRRVVTAGVSSAAQATANVAGTVGGSAGELAVVATQNNMNNTAKLLHDLGGAANAVQQGGSVVANTTSNLSQPNNTLSNIGQAVSNAVVNLTSSFANWLSGN